MVGLIYITIFIFFDPLVGKMGPNWANFFMTIFSRLLTSHVTKLTSIVCIYNMMSETKYEEDTLMRSKVMPNLVWKSELPSKFEPYFQKKGLGSSYVTKLSTMFGICSEVTRPIWRRFNYVFKNDGNFKFWKFDEILKKWNGSMFWNYLPNMKKIQLRL